MERPKVLPLPGNSSREGNFYEEQRPSGLNVEWPGNASLGIDQGTNGAPTAADPSPFKIVDNTGGR